MKSAGSDLVLLELQGFQHKLFQRGLGQFLAQLIDQRFPFAVGLFKIDLFFKLHHFGKFLDVGKTRDVDIFLAG